MPTKRECHAEQRGASKEDRGEHSVRFKSSTAAPIPCSSHLWKRAPPFSQGSLLVSNYCFIARASELLSGPISGIMGSAMAAYCAQEECTWALLAHQELFVHWVPHDLTISASDSVHGPIMSDTKNKQPPCINIGKWCQIKDLQEWWSPTPHGSGVKAAFWLGVRLELWRTSYHLRLWWIQLVHTAVGWPPEMWK